MREKSLETGIIAIINSFEYSRAWNANNIPVPIFDKSRNFGGFRKNSHVTGLSDINGILLKRPIYIECKTEESIKTFYKDIDAHMPSNLGKSTRKRMLRHKEQWAFLKIVEKCGALVGVVDSMKSFLELEWWSELQLGTSSINQLERWRNLANRR